MLNIVQVPDLDTILMQTTLPVLFSLKPLLLPHQFYFHGPNAHAYSGSGRPLFLECPSRPASAVEPACPANPLKAHGHTVSFPACL